MRSWVPAFSRLHQAEGASLGSQKAELEPIVEVQEVDSNIYISLMGKRAPSPRGSSLSTEVPQQGWMTTRMMVRGLGMSWVVGGRQGSLRSQVEAL